MSFEEFMSWFRVEVERQKGIATNTPIVDSDMALNHWWADGLSYALTQLEKPGPVGFHKDFLLCRARDLRETRNALHGGTRRRYDLLVWADALQWVVKKMREKNVGE